MSEWTVSWALWTDGRMTDWLDLNKSRGRAARLLSALDGMEKEAQLASRLTDDQKNLARYWRNLGKIRNAYAHHGMRPATFLGNDKEMSDVIGYWRELKQCPQIRTDITAPEIGTVLISPVGRRAGALFSAVTACKELAPTLTHCLLFCSRESRPLAEEALQRASFTGESSFLVLEDEFAGKKEIKRLAQPTRATLASAAQVVVNITGGTTLMGIAAKRLENFARAFAKPVLVFGVIDRRSAQEQLDDPYHVGEVLWADEDRSA